MKNLVILIAVICLLPIQSCVTKSGHKAQSWHPTTPNKTQQQYHPKPHKVIVPKKQK